MGDPLVGTDRVTVIAFKFFRKRQNSMLAYIIQKEARAKKNSSKRDRENTEVRGLLVGLAAAHEWRAIGYDGADRSMDIKRRKLLRGTWL